MREDTFLPKQSGRMRRWFSVGGLELLKEVPEENGKEGESFRKEEEDGEWKVPHKIK